MGTQKEAANTLLDILTSSSVEIFFIISLVSWKWLNTDAAWNRKFPLYKTKELLVEIAVTLGWKTFFERHRIS